MLCVVQTPTQMLNWVTAGNIVALALHMAAWYVS